MAEYSKRLQVGDPPIQVETIFHKTDEQLLRAVGGAPHGAIVLDERGAALTSEDFSEVVFAYLQDGGSRLVLAIGGADGLPAELRGLPPVSRELAERGESGLLALGRLTLPHRLVRVTLVEQLYRAQEIRRGSKYHRGDPLLMSDGEKRARAKSRRSR